MNAFGEAGLEIPRDIAVVGFDDIPLSRHVRPGLTTVRQPLYELGSIAAGIVIRLLDRTRNEIQPPENIKLETEIVIRESVTSRNGERSERAVGPNIGIPVNPAGRGGTGT